jgi:predicted transcriptional regulator
MKRLSTRELDVLSSLWNSDKPMTMTDISNSQHDLTQSTVNGVLRKLLSLDLIEVSGTARVGNTFGRTYVPKPSSKDVIMEYLSDSYKKFDKVIPKPNFFVALLESNDDIEESRNEIANLEMMLEEFKRNNGLE